MKKGNLFLYIGGSISGVTGVRFSTSTATISGGSISGNLYDDIQNYDSTITLTLGKDGVGATFPGGVSVFLDTLNAILGEGVAYWQGNTMILPADDATEITGGDVTVTQPATRPIPTTVPITAIPAPAVTLPSPMSTAIPTVFASAVRMLPMPWQQSARTALPPAHIPP